MVPFVYSKKSWLGFINLLLLPVFSLYSQQQNNYQYDSQGRLTTDLSEGIIKIEWNTKNKVTQIIRADTSHAPDVEFAYDAAGQHVMKLVKPRNGKGIMPESTWTYTYYVYDGSGQIIKMYDRGYEKDIDIDNHFKEQFGTEEQSIYANGRLGYKIEPAIMTSRSFYSEITTAGKFMNTNMADEIVVASIPTGLTTASRGQKRFEIDDHLGNVLLSGSDRKIKAASNNMQAEVQSASSYYAFGMLMPGRTYNSSNYRYGTNGQEKVQEVSGPGNHYIAKYWSYDSRLGRRWNLDPEPVPHLSNYSVFGDNPIVFSDPLGNKFTGNAEDIEVLRARFKPDNEKLDKEKPNYLLRKTAAQEGAKLLKELDALEKSPTEYHIILGGEYHAPNRANIFFDGKSIVIDVNDRSYKTLTQMLTYAYQYETGRLSLSTSGFGSLYDWQDELEAQNRANNLFPMLNLYKAEPYNLATFEPSRPPDDEHERRLFFPKLRLHQTTIATPGQAINMPGKSAPKFGSRPTAPSVRILTWGDIIRMNIIDAGQHGEVPREVINGWQEWYKWGYEYYKQTHK